MPWNPPRNTDRPTEPLSDAGIEAIHDGAMRILEVLGIDLPNEDAFMILARAGCSVDGPRVRMGRDFVMEMVVRVPSSFTVTPRNPARKLVVGDGHILSGNVSSPPSTWDLGHGKRPGLAADLR